MLGQCAYLLQNALRKITLAAVGDRFTFTICSYFCRIGIVVPLYSHATKSTSILKIIRHTSSDKIQLFTTQNPTQHYTKTHNKINYLHTISRLPHLTPYLTQTLINPTQINKISPKTPHPHNTYTSNPIPNTNPNKTLLKLRIIPHTPKIITLI